MNVPELDDDDEQEKLIRYADWYRKRLEQKINAPIGDRGHGQAPQWLREIRAENEWRKMTGRSPDPAWTVEGIITALVVRAFGEPVRSEVERG